MTSFSTPGSSFLVQSTRGHHRQIIAEETGGPVAARKFAISWGWVWEKFVVLRSPTKCKKSMATRLPHMSHREFETGLMAEWFWWFVLPELAKLLFHVGLESLVARNNLSCQPLLHVTATAAAFSGFSQGWVSETSGLGTDMNIARFPKNAVLCALLWPSFSLDSSSSRTGPGEQASWKSMKELVYSLKPIKYV